MLVIFYALALPRKSGNIRRSISTDDQMKGKGKEERTLSIGSGAKRHSIHNTLVAGSS
jgi:hypothetical protein